MTGPEHYRVAERLVEDAGAVMNYEHGIYASMGTEERIKRQAALLAAAQVHSTLALAAATALGREGEGRMQPSQDRSAWFDAAAECRKAVTA